MTKIEDTIHIHLRDCTVPLFVGVYDHEKPLPQHVVVNVVLVARLTERFDDLKSSNLSRVVDYDGLYEFVTDVLPALGHIPLLESVGERIITFCFEDPRIIETRVRLDKPEAYKDKALVGIEMRRTRSFA